MTEYVIVGDIEMTKREYRMLKIIIDFMASDLYHQPPSHRHLVDALNKVGENIISTEQTFRVAYTLRKKKLLVEPPPSEEIRRNHNLVPTPLAIRIMKLKPTPST